MASQIAKRGITSAVQNLASSPAGPAATAGGHGKYKAKIDCIMNARIKFIAFKKISIDLRAVPSENIFNCNNYNFWKLLAPFKTSIDSAIVMMT